MIDLAPLATYVLGIAFGFWLGRVALWRSEDRLEKTMAEMRACWRESDKRLCEMLHQAVRPRRRRIVFRWREAGEKADQAVRDGTGEPW